MSICLIFCMLGNISCFLCRLLTFFKINFFKKFFQEHHQYVKQLDIDQDDCHCDVGPNLGPKLLQKLSADEKSRCKQVKGKELVLNINVMHHYCKTCVKRPLSKRPKIDWLDQLLLDAECPKGSILQYF